MTTIQEFLESSTIHGLLHISQSRSSLIRTAWAIIVAFAISMSWLLINKSFQSWNLSPVITTLDTMDINELPFPPIVICPPRNSNTGLNLDILNSGNMKFRILEFLDWIDTMDIRAQTEEHQAFVEEITSYVSNEDIKLLAENKLLIDSIFSGKIGHKFLRRKMLGNGSFESPFYNQSFSPLTHKSMYVNYFVYFPVRKFSHVSILREI